MKKKILSYSFFVFFCCGAVSLFAANSAIKNLKDGTYQIAYQIEDTKNPEKVKKKMKAYLEAEIKGDNCLLIIPFKEESKVEVFLKVNEKYLQTEKNGANYQILVKKTLLEDKLQLKIKVPVFPMTVLFPDGVPFSLRPDLKSLKLMPKK